MRTAEQRRRPLQDWRMSMGWDLRREKKGGGAEDEDGEGWRGVKSKEEEEEREG